MAVACDVCWWPAETLENLEFYYRVHINLVNISCSKKRKFKDGAY